LAVENLFLNKSRDDKGIRAPTFEQEKAHRCRRPGGRQVAAAPVMNAEAVQQQFDEQMLGTWLGIFACVFDLQPLPMPTLCP